MAVELGLRWADEGNDLALVVSESTVTVRFRRSNGIGPAERGQEEGTIPPVAPYSTTYQLIPSAGTVTGRSMR